jgi:hypothetical protein
MCWPRRNRRNRPFSEQLAQARKSFEVGASTITDTHEAQARYDLTVAQEIAAHKRSGSETSRHWKRSSTAKVPSWLAWREGVRHVLAGTQQHGRLGQAGGRRQPVGAVGLPAPASNWRGAMWSVCVGGHLPDIWILTANYNKSRNPSSTISMSVDKGGSIGLEFGWLLYQGGAIDSRVREAVAIQEKTRYELDGARRQARLDARQGFLGVLSGDAQVKALEQALVSSEAQLKSTKLGLEVGVRTRVDVLNAQQQLFTTRRDLCCRSLPDPACRPATQGRGGNPGCEEDLKAVDALLREVKVSRYHLFRIKSLSLCYSATRPHQSVSGPVRSRPGSRPEKGFTAAMAIRLSGASVQFLHGTSRPSRSWIRHPGAAHDATACSAASLKFQVCGPISAGQPAAAASIRFWPPNGNRLPPM